MITDAVSTQPWSGEAVVEVSIVNWIKAPDEMPAGFVLNEVEVEAIDTALDESTIPVADVPVLPANRRRAFQGFLPGAKYDIDVELAEQLLSSPDAAYVDVVKPYLDGRDIARAIDQRPTRYTIDFGQMPLEDAMRYPQALALVREQAKHARETSTSHSRNPHWWQFLWPRPEFRGRLLELERFIAGTATGKRILFVWCERDWRPSNSTNIFALDSDYAMGVLTSRVHTGWAAKKSSTLRVDIRYTPTSAFDTFPWPDSSAEQRERIAGLVIGLLTLRSTLCGEHGLGLTALYNAVDDGAFAALRDAHVALDLAVITAYGWSSALLDDVRARNRALFDLNAEILAGTRPYSPF